MALNQTIPSCALSQRDRNSFLSDQTPTINERTFAGDKALKFWVLISITDRRVLFSPSLVFNSIQMSSGVITRQEEYFLGAVQGTWRRRVSVQSCVAGREQRFDTSRVTKQHETGSVSDARTPGPSINWAIPELKRRQYFSCAHNIHVIGRPRTKKNQFACAHTHTRAHTLSQALPF